jgi:hypothetical protein
MHKTTKAIAAVAVAIIVWTVPIWADRPIAPKTYQALLQTGIDVNWAMWKKEVRFFSEQTVRDFKQAGFDHIRIRFRIDHARSGLDREGYYRHIDNIIRLVLKNNMTPILALGAEQLKREPTEANLQEAVALWRDVAQRYRHQSHRLAFDLMIEPARLITRHPDILNRYYAEAMHAIRTSNPDRIVFIAPPKLAQPATLDQLRIPKESNGYVMVETHFYAAGPSPTNPKKRWTTGTEAEKALLRQHFETALAWQKAHNIPIWIGAIMPGDYNHGDHYSIAQQVHFATFIRSLFRAHHVPFAINADQQFYDLKHHRWRSDRLPVLEAILE